MPTLKKIISTSILSALVLSTAMGARQASAAAHLPVTLYQNYAYESGSKEFDVGLHNMNELSNSIGNDTLSSIRVAPGYKVTLYSNSDFAGSAKVLTADNYNLGDFNDQTSSLKIERIAPTDPTGIAVPGNKISDGFKNNILQALAPRIWMGQGETFNPSSVEYHFSNMVRYFNSDLGKYALKTINPLSPYTQKLPFFAGEQLKDAPIYAFWVEKDYNNLDLVYYQFYPYNYGKIVLGAEFGDHVGDWERVTVRLTKYMDNGNLYVKPVQVLFGAHGFVNVYDWSQVDKVNGNHPVAYSAVGSHGMWKDAGSNVYKNIVVAKLTDVTSQGSAWDTWNNIKTFEYYPGQPIGKGLNTQWPSWLNKDYTNPDGQAVYKWGNPEQGSVFGQALLENGPGSPQDNEGLNDPVKLW